MTGLGLLVLMVGLLAAWVAGERCEAREERERRRAILEDLERRRRE